MVCCSGLIVDDRLMNMEKYLKKDIDFQTTKNIFYFRCLNISACEPSGEIYKRAHI